MPVPDSTSENNLQWSTQGLHAIPSWTRDLDISAVAQIAYTTLELSAAEILSSTTKYLTHGAFNKIYVVECPKGKYVMRVTLPIDSSNKTRSEVATMRVVAAHTTVPVPRVVGYDASRGNGIGFEWILMQYMPGRPLEEIWDGLTWEVKVGIVIELADWMSQLFRVRCGGIGSLYDSELLSKESTGFSVGPLVLHQSTGSRIQGLLQAQGPFPSSRQWLRNSSETESSKLSEPLEQQDDGARVDRDDGEITQGTLALLERLRPAIEMIFPENGDSSETELFALYHRDVSFSNVMATEEGNLTALIDWEFSASMPLYKVADYPSLLIGPDLTKHDRPRQEDYPHDESGSVDELYWIRLRSYERTHLRPVFLKAMERNCEEWCRVFDDQANSRRRDVELALEQCYWGNAYSEIGRWLDRLDRSGEYIGLRQVMYEADAEPGGSAKQANEDICGDE